MRVSDKTAGLEPRGARPRVRGRLAAAFVTAVAWCALATPDAGAATAEIASDGFERVLVFDAGPGEGNALTATAQDSDRVQIIDTGANVEAGPGCSGGGAPGASVVCSEPGLSIDRIAIETRDGDDAVNLDGIIVAGRVLEIEILSGAGDDSITAGPAGAVVRPGPGDDRFEGGLGPDSVYAKPVLDSDDILAGGGEYDYVTYPRASSVSLAQDAFANDGAAGEHDSVTGFEKVETGAGDDVLVVAGRPGYLSLSTAAGDDLIVGGGDRRARTIVSAGTGADRLEGGPGTEIVHGEGGDDVLRGSGETDRLEGETGHDRVAGGAGRDYIFGGRGDDRLDATSAGPPGRPNRDRANCGQGRDVARVDVDDQPRHCEILRGAPE